jgi:hypothetical protein
MRPKNATEARVTMLEAESERNFANAALAAITLSDLASGYPDESAAFDRQALVYATLHQAEMALWIAENRQIVFPEGLQ